MAANLKNKGNVLKLELNGRNSNRRIKQRQTPYYGTGRERIHIGYNV